MENFKSIYKYCDDLKLDYPKLSDYELLSIAVQMQRNDILKAGLNVTQSDERPTSLEAIAMQLGITGDGAIDDEPGSILFELGFIREELEKIANK